MTTNYHDPVSVGASNHPSTVNTRFGTLDAQLSTVTTQINQLDLSSTIRQTRANGGETQPFTSITVDSASGFETGDKVGWIGASGTYFERTITVVGSEFQVASVTENIADNTIITAIPPAIQAAATAGRYGGTVTAPRIDQMMTWARQGIFYVDAYGASTSASAATNKTAIQAALDAANTASGGIVMFGPGTYTVTPPLEFYEGVTVQGQGIRKTFIVSDNTSTTSFFTPKNYGAAIGTPNRAAAFRHFRLSSGVAATASNVTNGIRLLDCQACIVEHVNIYAFPVGLKIDTTGDSGPGPTDNFYNRVMNFDIDSCTTGIELRSGNEGTGDTKSANANIIQNGIIRGTGTVNTGIYVGRRIAHTSINGVQLQQLTRPIYDNGYYTRYSNVYHELPSAAITGQHTGGNGEATLTDSTKNWNVNQFVGITISNTTDTTTATITANDATTITGTLSSGTWDTNDAYSIPSSNIVLGANAVGTQFGACLFGHITLHDLSDKSWVWTGIADNRNFGIKWPVKTTSPTTYHPGESWIYDDTSKFHLRFVDRGGTIRTVPYMETTSAISGGGFKIPLFFVINSPAASTAAAAPILGGTHSYYPQSYAGSILSLAVSRVSGTAPAHANAQMVVTVTKGSVGSRTNSQVTATIQSGAYNNVLATTTVDAHVNNQFQNNTGTGLIGVNWSTNGDWDGTTAIYVVQVVVEF